MYPAGNGDLIQNVADGQIDEGIGNPHPLSLHSAESLRRLQHREETQGGWGAM